MSYIKIAQKAKRYIKQANSGLETLAGTSAGGILGGIAGLLVNKLGISPSTGAVLGASLGGYAGHRFGKYRSDIGKALVRDDTKAVFDNKGLMNKLQVLEMLDPGDPRYAKILADIKAIASKYKSLKSLGYSQGVLINDTPHNYCPKPPIGSSLANWLSGKSKEDVVDEYAEARGDDLYNSMVSNKIQIK